MVDDPVGAATAHAEAPASTTSAWPVMAAARSESRKSDGIGDRRRRRCRRAGTRRRAARSTAAAGSAGGQVGGDEAGHHGVDPHAAPADLAGQRSG